jgi:integrase
MASKTNCVINGKPYYRIRKKIGVDADGKAIIKPFYGKNKTDAENQVKAWEENHKAGIDKDENFSVFMKYYIENVFSKDDHAGGTKIRYKGVYNKYIKESDILNQYKMNEIGGQAVQRYFNSLSATYSTKIAIRNIMTLFFQYADRQGYCRNPMDIIKVSRDKVKTKGIVIFSDEEVKKIINSEKTRYHSYNRFLFLFALGTGLRQGEILGLTYGDIESGKVRVVKQVVNSDEGRIIADTKTGNSVRYVPIPKTLLGELEEMKKGHKPADHIFASRYGNLMDVNNLTRSYKRFLKSIDVPYKDFHTLRRTYATTLCENGIDIKTIADLLGNTVAVVAKYYAFVSDKKKIEAVDKIENLFAVKTPRKY